jgi:hypothetical protein
MQDGNKKALATKMLLVLFFCVLMIKQFLKIANYSPKNSFRGKIFLKILTTGRILRTKVL